MCALPRSSCVSRDSIRLAGHAGEAQRHRDTRGMKVDAPCRLGPCVWSVMLWSIMC